ncbi:PilW family protein [Cryobacterium sp. M25]|uniref:PilW family protein n=1 Tax=Cryobacterium sp. M25 TaxID=2048293 RepID=UPI000CE57069|nr:type II secretion system protein [Cryobacterium sp. M25]
MAVAESGFTLIELLVASFVSILVLILVGSLLTNSMRIERDTRTVAEATDLGQLVARTVQSGVRNASKVSLANTGNTQLLRVRTAGREETPSWLCQAWYYTPDAGGALYMKVTSPAAPIPTPTTTTLTSWTKLGDGINPAGAQVFTSVLGLVTLDFTVRAGGSPPIPIKSTATTRTLETESTPCF